MANPKASKNTLGLTFIIASFVYGEEWLVTNYSNSFVIFAPYANVV